MKAYSVLKGQPELGRLTEMGTFFSVPAALDFTSLLGIPPHGWLPGSDDVMVTCFQWRPGEGSEDASVYIVPTQVHPVNAWEAVKETLGLSLECLRLIVRKGAWR